MEAVHPNEFLLGQKNAYTRLVVYIKSDLGHARERGDNPCEDDELYTKSYWRGEETYLNLALAKIERLNEELANCAAELEANVED